MNATIARDCTGVGPTATIEQVWLWTKRGPKLVKPRLYDDMDEDEADAAFRAMAMRRLAEEMRDEPDYGP